MPIYQRQKARWKRTQGEERSSVSRLRRSSLSGGAPAGPGPRPRKSAAAEAAGRMQRARMQLPLLFESSSIPSSFFVAHLVRDLGFVVQSLSPLLPALGQRYFSSSFACFYHWLMYQTMQFFKGGEAAHHPLWVRTRSPGTR